MWPRSTLCDLDPISCPILTTILVAIIPRYRDARYWYPILTPISEYHDIGTPDIDPDIDPDIGYMVYDIGDMMTRYRVCTRYWYPISGHIRHVPISGQTKNTISIWILGTPISKLQTSISRFLRYRSSTIS